MIGQATMSVSSMVLPIGGRVLMIWSILLWDVMMLWSILLWDVLMFWSILLWDVLMFWSILLWVVLTLTHVTVAAQAHGWFKVPPPPLHTHTHTHTHAHILFAFLSFLVYKNTRHKLFNSSPSQAPRKSYHLWRLTPGTSVTLRRSSLICGPGVNVLCNIGPILDDRLKENSWKPERVPTVDLVTFVCVCAYLCVCVFAGCRAHFLA